MEEKKINRRKFLAGLGIGTTAIVGSSISSACSQLQIGGGIDHMIKISKDSTKDLYPIFDGSKYIAKDFTSLTTDKNLGLSKANLENHFGLYKKYIAKVNEAEEKIKKGIIDEFTMKNLAFSLNGMALHDVYFSNMSSQAGSKSKALVKAIEDSYGSFDAYLHNLCDIAGQVKGWAITAVNLLNGKIINYGVNDHSSNFPNYILPILTFDVYEHAYEIDFQKAGKMEYVKLFPQIINWDIVSRRYDKISKTFA